MINQFTNYVRLPIKVLDQDNMFIERVAVMNKKTMESQEQAIVALLNLIGSINIDDFVVVYTYATRMRVIQQHRSFLNSLGNYFYQFYSAIFFCNPDQIWTMSFRHRHLQKKEFHRSIDIHLFICLAKKDNVSAMLD